MKKYVLIGVLFTFPQLGQAADLKAAANDVCACAADAIALANEQMAALQQGKSVQDIMAMQEEVMAVASKVESCFEGLRTKYPDIENDETKQNQVMAMAAEMCPNPIFDMAGGGQFPE